MRRSALALLTFVATLGLQRSVLSPAHSTLTPKLEAFRQSADDFTTLFLGPSVVYRHIDPRVFDLELNRAGFESRSFNLGAPAMPLGEAAYLARTILDGHPSQLRFLIVDLNLVEIDDTGNELTQRFINWHDAPSTAFAMSATLASGHPLLDRLRFAAADARASLYNVTRVGAVSTMWSDGSYDHPVGNQGFEPLGWADPDEVERHQRFLGHLDEYREQVQSLRAAPAREDTPEIVRRFFARIVGDCRAHGVTPIVISSPMARRIPGPGVDAPMLDFRDPERYPELYDPRSRFDRGHLTAEAAAVYTRLLAQRFIELRNAVH